MIRRLATWGVAIAIGLWAAMPDAAQAQKGGKGGGGGGGGGARSAPSGGRSFSGPSGGRSFSGPSIGSSAAPTIRSAPSIGGTQSLKSGPPANVGGPGNAGRVAKSNIGGPNGPGGPVVKSNIGSPNGPAGNNFANNANKGPGNSYANDARWNGQGRNYHDYRYYGGHNGYPYHNYHHHHDDFWRFVLYSSVADWIGYRHFGFPAYGAWGYAPYYYGVPDVIYDPQVVPAQALARSSSAAIEMLLPDPDARVWIDGNATTSRGANRRYETPELETGWNYSYTVRAVWISDDGQAQTIERQVPLAAGSRVTVDFTSNPSRIMQR